MSDASHGLAVLVLIAGVAVTGLANELRNGTFDSPDNNSWVGSSWSTWTTPGACGREWWAQRVGPQEGAGTRGAAGYGWMAASEMGIYQDVPGKANITYTFKVWCRREINYNPDIVQLNIEWLDINHAFLTDHLYLNITPLVSNTWQQFTVSGSTTNTNCAFARAVIYTRWLDPTNITSASMQFDDAEVTATPPTFLQIK